MVHLTAVATSLALAAAPLAGTGQAQLTRIGLRCVTAGPQPGADGLVIDQAGYISMLPEASWARGSPPSLAVISLAEWWVRT